MASGKKQLIVKYKNDLYDLTEFSHKHPGGSNSLNGLHNTNMDERFLKAPQHSNAAMYLMKEYKINNDQNNIIITKKNGFGNGFGNGFSNGIEKNGELNRNGNRNRNRNRNNSNENDDDNYDNNTIISDNNKNDNQNTKNKVNQNATNKNDINHDFEIETDESMEYLVDWTKAMVPQVYKLGNQYDEWVNKPVDRPLRLLGPTWMENLTKTPWWVVPLYWIPIIIYYLSVGLNETIYLEKRYTSTIIINLILGFIAWSLIEYSIHRWVFHLNRKNTHPILRIFHFLLHGQHHKVPFDELRLVFPPVPSTILAILFYQPFRFIFNCPRVALAGGLIGYLTYDMIHYYIHYGSPKGGHLYIMKRYHFQHHFVHADKGFGISTQMWDGVFDTKIILRKLKYMLKW